MKTFLICFLQRYDHGIVCYYGVQVTLAHHYTWTHITGQGPMLFSGEGKNGRSVFQIKNKIVHTRRRGFNMTKIVDIVEKMTTNMLSGKTKQKARNDDLCLPDTVTPDHWN